MDELKQEFKELVALFYNKTKIYIEDDKNQRSKNIEYISFYEQQIYKLRNNFYQEKIIDFLLIPPIEGKNESYYNKLIRSSVNEDFLLIYHTVYPKIRIIPFILDTNNEYIKSLIKFTKKCLSILSISSYNTDKFIKSYPYNFIITNYVKVILWNNFSEDLREIGLKIIYNLNNQRDIRIHLLEFSKIVNNATNFNQDLKKHLNLRLNSSLEKRIKVNLNLPLYSFLFLLFIVALIGIVIYIYLIITSKLILKAISIILLSVLIIILCILPFLIYSRYFSLTLLSSIFIIISTIIAIILLYIQ